MSIPGKRPGFRLVFLALFLFLVGCGGGGSKVPVVSNGTHEYRLASHEYITGDYLSRVPEDETEMLNSPERKVILSPELVIRTLKIKPGMNILDIGAGHGTFTFQIAKALRNTGNVFATEAAPKLFKYLEEEVKKKHTKNITPILVSYKAADPFYKKHAFDIIFACELWPYLNYPVAYFKELKQSLVKGTGRLYIINFRYQSDFHEVDFGDCKIVISALRSKGNEFPVFRRLDADLQRFIKKHRDNDTVPKEIRNKILQNFNKMLPDRFLLNDLKDYYILNGYYNPPPSDSNVLIEWEEPFLDQVQPVEVSLFKWLFVQLDAAGVFDGKEKILTAGEKEQLLELNKIILAGIFRIYTVSILKNQFFYPIFPQKTSIISKMNAAGYELVQDHDFLSQYYFLEFKQKI